MLKEFEQALMYAWAIIMDAREMIYEALENKHERPDLAAVYYRIASDRLTDADLLIKQIESCLDKAEEEKHDDAESMSVLWEADHGRMLRQISQVKIMQDMYR